MNGSARFEELLAEGTAGPVDGWDFDWFAGRATEERPSWGYSRLVREAMAGATSVLDVQTGGGEVLAEVLVQLARRPGVICATEGWPPNVAIARRNLRRSGGAVVEVSDRAGLPFADGGFDLVVSRHPAVVQWEEIARVLAPGGTYLSQQVGAGSQRELAEALLGPRPAVDPDRPAQVAAAATAAGLTVVDVRHESLRTVFHDIAAVVLFLRKVVWTVPGFTVAGYRRELAALHDRITTEGPFVSYAQRLLVEARKPAAKV